VPLLDALNTHNNIMSAHGYFVQKPSRYIMNTYIVRGQIWLASNMYEQNIYRNVDIFLNLVVDQVSPPVVEQHKIMVTLE